MHPPDLILVSGCAVFGKSLDRFELLKNSSQSIKALYDTCFYVSAPGLLVILVAGVLVLIVGVTALYVLLAISVSLSRLVVAYFSLLSLQLRKDAQQLD